MSGRRNLPTIFGTPCRASSLAGTGSHLSMEAQRPAQPSAQYFLSFPKSICTFEGITFVPSAPSQWRRWLMVLHLAVLTAALSPGLQPTRAVPHRSAILSRHSPPTAAVAADVGRAVASWCVSAGREHATVAVSGADCIAGVLRDFWSVARVFAQEDCPHSRQRVLALPSWVEGSADPQLFQALLQHLVACAEICEYVGESLLVAGRHPAAVNGDEPDGAPCPMLLLRAYTQAASSVGEVYSGTNPYSGTDLYGGTDPHAGEMDVAEQSWASDECA